MSTKNFSNKNQRPHRRFGIMCNGTTFPAWEASCLQKLLVIDNVEPALLIIDNNSLTASNNLKKLKKLMNFKRFFWYTYNFIFIKRLSRSMHPVDMSSVLAQVPYIYCKVIKKGKFSQYFSESDIVKIREYNLDFILRFGFNIIRGEILEVPSFGVWSFHHGDEEKYRGSPPGFWEIYNSDNVTGSILQRLTDRLDSGIVLKKGFFKTINTSYVRNRDEICFQSTDWPAQICIDIQNGNANYINSSPSKTSAPIFHDPNNLQMIIFLIKIVKNFILKLFNNCFFYFQWNIGIVDTPIHVFLTPDNKPVVRWLPAPAWNNFNADPFATCNNKTIKILFEDYEYSTSKGCISAISIDRQSFFLSKAVIDTPFHMSYPYLLEYNNQIYCIPETSQANEVSLYKAKEFPNNWVKIATLIENFAGLDSTVFQYNGYWWLFATDANDGFNYKLQVWYASDLFGPWKPHAANPVKLDIRSARPAGTPFMYNSYLYRPSQDCSETYGGKIVLNRVIRLTPTEFKEEQIAVIEPYKNSPYPDALHTISAVSNMTLIDGAKKVFGPKILFMLISMMRSLLLKKK